MAVRINVEIFPPGIRELAMPQGQLARDFLRTGRQVEAHVKRHTPTLTGRLRNSISTELSAGPAGFQVLVSSRVNYAGYTEYGTHHERARHMFHDGLREVLRR